MTPDAALSTRVLARLADLSAHHDLSKDQQAQLAQLLVLLEGDRDASTTVRDPERAVEVHLADSLAGLTLAPVSTAVRVADLGSGAGFPGLPLAIARPGASVTLVESVSRRIAFPHRAALSLGLTNVAVVPARAEEWEAGLEAHDLVTARALAPPAVVAEYAAPLLSMGGHLVQWRGRRDAHEEAAAREAAARLGLEVVEIRSIQPWPEARDLHLHLYVKTRLTPPEFPRRAGMARKRPLPG